jgi:hypothetical protein
MIEELSLHRITDVKVKVPDEDFNWVELEITNSKAQKFELTFFLRQSHEENIDMYQFLAGLRDSVEQAIRDTLNVKNKSDD